MTIELKSIIARTVDDQSDKLFKNDTGKVIRIYSGIDLTNATAIIMKVKKPSGSEVDWTASLDATNNRYAKYTIQTNDLNVVGEYAIQIQVTFSASEIHKGSTTNFEVFDKFADKDIIPEPH